VKENSDLKPGRRCVTRAIPDIRDKAAYLACICVASYQGDFRPRSLCATLENDVYVWRFALIVVYARNK